MTNNQQISFESLKSVFKTETGKEWNENISNYCQYVQAKNSLITASMLIDIRNFLSQITEHSMRR